jgi:hypothetical protein
VNEDVQRSGWQKQDWDVRTTPKWAQIPYLVFLALVVVYLSSCFHFALRERPPKWVWFGYWQMFSLYDRGSADLEAEVRFDDEWQPIDLTELFPTRWESGYRYSRSSFRRSKGRLRVLAGSVCLRAPRRPSMVRLHQVTWKKQLGSFTERVDEQREKVLEHRCGTPVKLVGGRRL